jgi:hypothetical protein
VPVKHDLEETWPSPKDDTVKTVQIVNTVGGGITDIISADTLGVETGVTILTGNPALELTKEGPNPFSTPFMGGGITDIISADTLGVETGVTILTGNPVLELNKEGPNPFSTPHMGGSLPVPLEAKVLSPNMNPIFAPENSTIKPVEITPMAAVAEAQVAQPVSAATANPIINAVNVYENADIRVIKLV